jgi:ribosomal protein L21E
LNLIGPKVASRKLRCRDCYSEIPKGSEYWVEEGYEEKRWLEFNPKYGAPSFRYPTHMRYYQRKRVLCNTCKERALEVLEIRRRENEEWKRKMRKVKEVIDQVITEFIFETLGKGEADIYTIETAFRKSFPKNGYDGKTGQYTGPTSSHLYEKLMKLVDEGVVERIPDERFGCVYRLKKQ